MPTIRYYEEVGLLPQAGRSAGGHRMYREADLRRLTFIRRCRDFGFPIECVRELVSLLTSPERDCTAARDVAQVHLAEVRSKLKELRALERSLQSLVEDCSEECVGGPASDCIILEDLASPREQCGASPEAEVATCCTGKSRSSAA